jgi:hypothetical protein
MMVFWEKLFEIMFVQAAPQVAFVVGLLYILFKLGSLWIVKHFEKMVPIYERQTAAVEKLATTLERGVECAKDFTLMWDRDHRVMFSGVRAAHARLDDLEGKT